MNKDLAAQFLSAIITRNSGQRIEDDVKEALAYAETFERLTADYTTPKAVQDKFPQNELEHPAMQLNRKIREIENRVNIIQESLNFTATFKKSSSDDLIQNPTFQLSRAKEWSVRFNDTFADFYTQDFRNDLLRSLLNSYAKCEKVTFLVAANNGILSTWEDKERILNFYGEEKDILVLSCFTETEVKQKIDAYYEERGGFAKHVEYLKSIKQW